MREERKDREVMYTCRCVQGNLTVTVFFKYSASSAFCQYFNTSFSSRSALALLRRKENRKKEREGEREGRRDRETERERE